MSAARKSDNPNVPPQSKIQAGDMENHVSQLSVRADQHTDCRRLPDCI